MTSKTDIIYNINPGFILSGQKGRRITGESAGDSHLLHITIGCDSRVDQFTGVVGFHRLPPRLQVPSPQVRLFGR